MGILIPAIWAIVFAVVIWKWKFFRINGIAVWWMLGLFAVKLCASFVLDFIYTCHYQNVSDIYKYFRDAQALYASIHSSVLDFIKIICGIDMDSPEIQAYIENTDHWTRLYDYGLPQDNQTIVRANMLIMLVSFGHIGVHYVFADFISIFSYTLIFKALQPHFKSKKALFLFVFLMPSAILWTAGMLKEVIVMLGIGLAFYGMTRCSAQFSLKHFAAFIVGIAILTSIKLYVLLALCPAITGYFINKTCKCKRPGVTYLSLCVFGLLLLGIADFGLHRISFFDSLATKRTDFINTAIVGDAGSYIPIGKIESTPMNFLRETPKALWNSIALPYPWSCTSALQIIPAFESLLLLVLIVLSVCFFKKPKHEQKNLLWFSLCFSLVMLWCIGISTPVVGAIVRYKIPVFPFLYTTFAALIDWHTLEQRIHSILQWRQIST